MSPKILWLTENYFPQKGGMAESCDRIVHQLRLRGLEIDVFHFTTRINRIKISNVHQGKNIAFPMEADLAHCLNLAWLFLKNHAEEYSYTHLAVFGGYVPVFAGPVFASWLNLPLITLLRGNDFDTAVFDPRRREFLTDCLQRSACICSVSKDKLLRVNAMYPHLKTAYIPNGIDLKDWEMLESDKKLAKAWRSQNLEGDKTVIGVFGYLKSKKGLLFFLQCLKVSALSARFHLLIVGEMSEDVQLYLEENEGVFSYTHYPFMERFALIPYYLASDIIAIPSFYDGLPNVLLEGGALGKPFLAARAAGMEDVLEDGKDAFLFKANDWQDCKKAIYKLSQSTVEERVAMGAYCRKKIETQLNHEIEANNYMAVFGTDLLA